MLSGILRGLDRVGRLSAITAKETTFATSSLLFLYVKSFLKRVLLQKERMCSLGDQIPSFQSRPSQNNFDKEISTERVIILLRPQYNLYMHAGITEERWA